MLVLVCGLPLFFGSVAFVIGMNDILNAASSKNWPSAKGTIVRSKRMVTSGSKPGDSSVTADIQYQYEVNESMMMGDNITYGGVTNKQIADLMVERNLKTYTVGRQVTVYYDASDPKKSVLQPGYSGGLVFLPILGSVFMACGIIFGIAIWKSCAAAKKNESVKSPYNF